VTEKLEGDRYRLKALTNKRTYKYSHEFLRRLPGKGIATELDDECDDEEITELTKLDPKFRGPFLVTEILGGDRYRLKALTNNRTYKTYI